MEGEEGDEQAGDDGDEASYVGSLRKIARDLLKNVKFSDFLVETHRLI